MNSRTCCMSHFMISSFILNTTVAAYNNSFQHQALMWAWWFLILQQHSALEIQLCTNVWCKSEKQKASCWNNFYGSLNMCVLHMCTGSVGFLAGSVTCAQDKQIGKKGGGVSLYNREQSADEARLSSEMVLNCKPSNIPTTNFDSKLLEGLTHHGFWCSSGNTHQSTFVLW